MIFPAAAVALLSTFVTVHSLQIDTPSSVVVCEPVALHFSGGTAPYYVSLLPAGQPGGTPLKQFPSTTDNSVSWMVDLQPGVTFSLSLRDGQGDVAFSDKVKVQEGPDNSCVSGSASPIQPPEVDPAVAGGQASSSTSTVAAAGNAPPAGTPAPASAATSSAAGAGAANTGAASTRPTVTAAGPGGPAVKSSAPTTSAKPSSKSSASSNRKVALGLIGSLVLVGVALC